MRQTQLYYLAASVFPDGGRSCLRERAGFCYGGDLGGAGRGFLLPGRIQTQVTAPSDVTASSEALGFAIRVAQKCEGRSMNRGRRHKRRETLMRQQVKERANIGRAWKRKHPCPDDAPSPLPAHGVRSASGAHSRDASPDCMRG